MRSNEIWTGLVGTMCLLTLAACGDSTGFKYEREVGVIHYYSDSVHITVPDTVASGAAFQVQVVTYGGGCVAQGDTKVTLFEDSAVVTPYDVYTVDMPANFACTAELALYTHTAPVHFNMQGNAKIVVNGRRQPQGSAIQATRNVFVK